MAKRLNTTSALPDEQVMERNVRAILIVLACVVLMPSTSFAQWPYAPPAPQVPTPPLPPSAPLYPQQAPTAPQAPAAQQYGTPAPAQQRHQQPQQHQQSQEYAFRPDLSNADYGQCLGLEKNWRDLWHRYAQGYQQARSLHPQDPRYAQMSYYLADLKRRLDAAWYQFSSRCIYFPANRR